MFREQPSTHSRVPDQLGLPRLERILKHVVSHLATLLDAGRFVERPVNAQVNATLTVPFLRLGERRERAERRAERRWDRQSCSYAWTIPNGSVVCQRPRVKSGKSTAELRFAFDRSLSWTTALSAAASYTFMSVGRPSRRHLIRR
jgi:hypothetical protein